MLQYPVDLKLVEIVESQLYSFNIIPLKVSDL